MNEQIIQNALAFLNRSKLEGHEVPMYLEVMKALSAELEKLKQHKEFMSDGG